MSSRVLSASLLATVLAGGVALTAQTQQPPAQQPSSQAAGQQEAFTLIACVQKETDVLKKGTPIPATPGMGDEFVFTQATKKAAGSDKPEAQPPAGTEATGTSGTQNKFGKVYRATGDRESDLKSYVGQRVEITATFKNAQDATREHGAVGTSGAAPVELTADNTPEIVVQSVTPASGSCAPIVK